MAIAINQNNKILIEVAAQHPLINGIKPNEEFRGGRLDKAIEFSKKHRELECYFYVPGNLHMENGIADKIALSNAGKNYLLDAGIPEDRIFGLESNKLYKGSDGVYNSTDECFVAASLWKDHKFARLLCVYSPAQMMRKVFSYIAFGIVPEVEVFSCQNMYHDYVEEYFRAIPTLLNDSSFYRGLTAKSQED